MSLNKTIIDALKPLNVPVGFQKYSGKALTYITFNEYLTRGEAFEDDHESYTGHYIQVDIWSKEDLTSVKENVKRQLESINFKRLDEIDLYEPETEIYHKGLRFFYLEEREVD